MGLCSVMPCELNEEVVPVTDTNWVLPSGDTVGR